MSSTSSSSSSSKQPRFTQRIASGVEWLRDSWDRITEGIALQDLWAQFRAEARSSYGLYSRDVDWQGIEQGAKWKRPFRIAWALFLAMLMKLSPARRLLLLFALVLMFLPVEVPTNHGGLTIEFPWHNLGVVIVFLLLALELADRVTMKRDLEIAREIQRWLVPESPPIVAGVDIAFSTRPANTVAGDYYDVITRAAANGRSERLLVVVADVAGKSVPAAMVMATLQASFRALEGTGEPFEDLVRGVNRYTCANSLNGLRFVTAFIAELDPATGEMIYTSAGHNPPLLRRTSGAIERLEIGGLPLGIEQNEQYPVGKVQIGAGDLLVVFTDGLVEAVNEQSEDFGNERLESLVSATPPEETAGGTLARLTGVLNSFVGAARQHDDITCLLLHRQ
jgi:sigma-B regulation protein RsbU (phosphoserine phosphatase)